MTRELHTHTHTVLLSNNSPTLQLAHFRFTTAWFVVYSRIGVTITTVNFKIFLSPHGETLHLVATPLLPPSLPRLGQALGSVLPLQSPSPGCFPVTGS